MPGNASASANHRLGAIFGARITAEYRKIVTYCQILALHARKAFPTATGSLGMSKIVIVLTENYADWESALCRPSQDFLRRGSADGEPRRGAADLGGRVEGDARSGTGNARSGSFDLLVLNGGMAWESGQAPEIGTLLQRPASPASRLRRSAGRPERWRRTDCSTPCRIPAMARTISPVSMAIGARRSTRPAGRRQRRGHHYGVGHGAGRFARNICEALGVGGPELDFYMGLFAGEHRAA